MLKMDQLEFGISPATQKSEWIFCIKRQQSIFSASLPIPTCNIHAHSRTFLYRIQHNTRPKIQTILQSKKYYTLSFFFFLRRQFQVLNTGEICYSLRVLKI